MYRVVEIYKGINHGGHRGEHVDLAEEKLFQTAEEAIAYFNECLEDIEDLDCEEYLVTDSKVSEKYYHYYFNFVDEYDDPFYKAAYIQKVDEKYYLKK